MSHPTAIPIGSLLMATACSALLLGQDHPTEPHRHEEAEKLKNPVENTAESIAAGAAIYDKLCGSCHGSRGHGDGRLAAGAAAYGPRPSNLADRTWQHGSSDGEIFLEMVSAQTSLWMRSRARLPTRTSGISLTTSGRSDANLRREYVWCLATFKLSIKPLDAANPILGKTHQENQGHRI